jgi:hypothetical protein
MKMYDPALTSFQEGLQIWRELELLQPSVYRSHVAGTLINLGRAEQALKNSGVARNYIEEALQIWRELDRQQPGVYRSHLAMALINLGNVQCNNENVCSRAHQL